MPDRKTLPFTLRHLYDKATVDSLYGEYITMRIVPARPTEYARAVARGQYPDPPEGADLDAPLEFDEVEEITGFTVFGRRQYWNTFGLSNAPWANNSLRQPRG